MLIESKIKRIGGTLVTLDGINYRFQPTDAEKHGPHVCEVKNEAHCKVFLAIKEGYRDTAAVEEPEAVSLDQKAPVIETGENVIVIPHEDGDETVDLEQLDKAGLLDVMKRLKIREPAGSKTKQVLIATIVDTLNEAA